MMIVSGVENESSVILSNALEEEKNPLRGNFISWKISDLGDEATKIISKRAELSQRRILLWRL